MALLIRFLNFVCTFVGLALFSVACTNLSSNQTPLKKYYFPYEEMTGGQTYIYQCGPLDSLDNQVFHFVSQKIKGKWYLNGKIFRSDGVLTHEWQEEATTGGMVMNRYAMFLDQKNPRPCEIKYDDIFPFKANKNGVFLFDMNWTDPANPGTKYQLIRNRIFRGDTVLKIMDKNIECIHFKIRERLEVNQEGILGLDMIGDEFYGKGIGLVRFVRQMGDRHPVFTLTSIEDK